MSEVLCTTCGARFDESEADTAYGPTDHLSNGARLEWGTWSACPDCGDDQIEEITGSVEDE